MILVTPYEGDKTKETYAIVEKAATYMRELAEKDSLHHDSRLESSC